MRKNLSIKNSGYGNLMYGKPAPKKSGNGWAGFYKEIYFRSLLELSYILYLEENNINFEKKENKSQSIEYFFEGKKRNFFIDFYLPKIDKYIELKSKNLINHPTNQAKIKAAKKQLGKKFILLTEKDVKSITYRKLKHLCIKGDIRLVNRYKDRLGDLAGVEECILVIDGTDKVGKDTIRDIIIRKTKCRILMVIRSYLSQIVYSRINKFDIDERVFINRMIQDYKKGDYFILLTASDNVIADRCIKTKEKDITTDQIPKHKKHFEKLVKELEGKVKIHIVDTSYKKPQESAYEILDIIKENEKRLIIGF